MVFLQKNLPQIKATLNDSEDKLNRFRQQNESVVLGLEAQSALKVIVDLEAQLNELTFKESDVSQRFTKDHPSYKSLLDKRQTLLHERERLNQDIQKLPKTQCEVLRMTRDVEVNQQIYIQLLNKVQELCIMKASAVGNVRILDTAQVFMHPVKPKKSLIVVLVTLFGGMLSVAMVLVKAAFHQGVESAEEIESIGLWVYASVHKSDMRKGYLQKSFNLQWDNGMSELLADKLSIQNAIKPSRIEGLEVITRGMVPPNPSELLMHQRFSELLEWASEHYDLVLVDTPLVLAVTDPSIVGAQAGTTLMVARFGQNSLKEIARDRFNKSGIEVKGVILNAIEKKASNRYYQYSYE